MIVFDPLLELADLVGIVEPTADRPAVPLASEESIGADKDRFRRTRPLDLEELLLNLT